MALASMVTRQLAGVRVEVERAVFAALLVLHLATSIEGLYVCLLVTWMTMVFVFCENERLREQLALAYSLSPVSPRSGQ